MNEGVHHPAGAVVEMALGGKTASQMYEGEKKFDIRIRYQPEFRKSEDEINMLMVPTIRGTKIPIKEIAQVKTVTGPAFIYRDNNKRFIGVKFTVRDRDLGSTIREARDRINNGVVLPKGYDIQWAGEFENQARATARLVQVVPISLILIFDGDGSDEVTAARDALDVAFFDEPRESFANGRSAGTQLAGKLRFTQGRAGRANPVHDAVLDLDVDLLASARLDTLRVRAVYGSCQARRWTKSFNK